MKVKNTSREHYEKYENLVSKLGIKAESDEFMGHNKQYWTDQFERDQSLNRHHLSHFDSQDYWVRNAAYRSGLKSWSLCESVCCLKHIIIYQLLGVEPSYK